MIKLPKNQTQEVLYELITTNEVSCLSMPYMHGFRTRISELKNKHQIHFTSILDTKINKFGNSYNYQIHKLIDKEKALKVYAELTK